MAKNTILGYAVIGNDAHELGNYPDGPKGGIMLSGDDITIFASRKAANAAIARTRAYEKQNGLWWDTKYMDVAAIRHAKKF